MQFVAITLIAQKPTARGPEPTAAFGTPTIVHFGATLLISALARAPWPTITGPAILWMLMGLGGVAYELLIVRRMPLQDAYIPEFEDWLFHVMLPGVAYVILGLSAVAALFVARDALFGIGAAALLLLFIGIHNAWDAVVYHVFVARRSNDSDKR